MTRLSSARKVIGLLAFRVLQLRQQLQREQAVAATIRAHIDQLNESIAELNKQADINAYQGNYVRTALFRARGQRAVVLFRIATLKVQLGELKDELDEAENKLHRTTNDILELNKRQHKHEQWFAKERITRDLMRELQASEEFLEGKSNGFN